MDAGIETLERSAEDFLDESAVVGPILDKSVFAGGQASIGSKKELNYLVPAAFNQQMTMIAAWNCWYGSQKEVSAIAERLMKVRSPALATVHPTLKRARFPAAVLLPMLGTEELCSATRDAIPEEFSKIDLSSRLEVNVNQLLGQLERDRIKALCASAPAANVIDAVVDSWPVLRSLFEVGVFNRELASSLLILAALVKLVGAGLPKLSQLDRHRRDMAASILLRDLPAGIAGLMVDSSDYLAGLLRSLVDARKSSALLPAILDPNLALHLQMPQSQFADLVEHVQSSCVGRAHKGNTGLLRLLARVEAHAVALKPGRNALSIVYSQFVDGFARAEWLSLLDALKSHALSMEVPFDQKLFAPDLVGRDICLTRSASLEAVALIRTIISASNEALDAAGFIERADKRLSKVRDLHVQISSLGQNLTAGAMGKVAELAGNARTEILSNRGWFQAELDSFVPLIKAWQRFYDDWDRLSRKAGAPAAPKASASLALVERLPLPVAALAKPLTPELADVQEQLETALTHCEHLERELSEARTELFNHRTYRETLSCADAPSEMPQVDFQLMRRVATREALTPADVLAFIQFVAGGRVVVLESAWKSARQASAFPYSARMLEALNTMVFPYFESLKSGNPDAVARELLAGSYSAKESESVGGNPKFRVQREFVFEGQTRFFERHLKIGNGTGTRDGMRVYFDIFNGEKIVIAYAGPHLDCSTTS